MLVIAGTVVTQRFQVTGGRLRGDSASPLKLCCSGANPAMCITYTTLSIGTGPGQCKSGGALTTGTYPASCPTACPAGASNSSSSSSSCKSLGYACTVNLECCGVLYCINGICKSSSSSQSSLADCAIAPTDPWAKTSASSSSWTCTATTTTVALQKARSSASTACTAMTSLVPPNCAAGCHKSSPSLIERKFAEVGFSCNPPPAASYNCTVNGRCIAQSHCYKD